MKADLKYELIEKLIQNDDDLILYQIKNLLEATKIKFWDELNPKLKESIQRGLDQSKKGEGISHEEFMKEVKDRFAK